MTRQPWRRPKGRGKLVSALVFPYDTSDYFVGMLILGDRYHHDFRSLTRIIRDIVGCLGANV